MAVRVAEGRDLATALWAVAIAGKDTLATAALERLLGSLVSILGDLVLAHGSSGAVIVGSLATRLRDHLVRPAFHARFCGKARYARRMEAFRIRRLAQDDPGLLGAAAAWQHARG